MKTPPARPDEPGPEAATQRNAAGALAAPRGPFEPFQISEIEQSIPDRFRLQKRLHGGRPAVAAGDRILSYDALERCSNRIAYRLLQERGETSEPVVVLARQGLPLVAAILGILKAGKIYVPLSGAQPPETLRQVLQDCDPPLLVADNDHLEAVNRDAGSSRKVIEIEPAVGQGVADDPRLSLSPDRAACIYYTSGSTGRAKGVVDCHRNILHNVYRYTNSLAIGPADRLSLVQLPGFSGAVSSLFAAILNGAAVFPFDPRTSSAQLAEWVNSSELTMFHSVPSLFEHLLAGASSFPSLRVIRLEGDQAAARQVALFRRHFDDRCVLVNGLGLTETGLIRQFRIDPGWDGEGTVPVGYPVDDMEVSLVSPPKGGDAEVGEIAVRSRYLALGYWGRTELAEQRFSRSSTDPQLRTYRTGDLGRFEDDGCLTVVGRLGLQTRIGGQWIDVAVVEAALSRLEGVSGAVVVTEAGPGDRPRLAAAVVTADGKVLSVTRLRNELASILPPGWIPARFEFVSRLPLDRHGKVIRAGVVPTPNRRPSLDVEWAGPSGEVQSSLTELFEEILGIEGIGVHDDFTELGGDSLAAAELAARLGRVYGRSVPFSLLAAGLTVARLSAWLKSKEPPAGLVQLSEGPGEPVFFFAGSAASPIGMQSVARQLQADRPVYGLQDCDQSTGEAVPVPVVAARSVARIREVQPQGPYCLAGECFAGSLAYEAALQLQAAGHGIAAVILLDTAFPGGGIAGMIRRCGGLRLFAGRLLQRQGLLPPDPAPRRDQLRCLISRLPGCAVRGLSAVAGRGGKVSWRARLLGPDELSEARYLPSSPVGHTTLITVGPLTSQLGWTRLDPTLKAITLPVADGGAAGAHPTEAPYRPELVKLLRRILAR